MKMSMHRKLILLYCIVWNKWGKATCSTATNRSINTQTSHQEICSQPTNRMWAGWCLSICSQKFLQGLFDLVLWLQYIGVSVPHLNTQSISWNTFPKGHSLPFLSVLWLSEIFIPPHSKAKFSKNTVEFIIRLNTHRIKLQQRKPNSSSNTEDNT